MGTFHEFTMERMMSAWENSVDYNLSESGVHPMTLGELLETSSTPTEDLLGVELGYPQTNGIESLRQTIAALYPGAGVDNVFVTVGAAEANYLVMTSLLEPGDEIVIVLPNYQQVHGIALNRGIVIRPVHLDEERGWALDTDALEEAVGPRTRLVAVCNPNNPTGRILTEDEMRAVTGAAERVGAWLLADEVYRGAEREAHGSQETRSFYGLTDRVLAQGSMSKAYGLPGLRVGWTVGPPDAIDELWKRHEYTTISSSMLSNRLATLALSADVRPRILERTRGFIRAGYDQLAAWAAENGSRLELTPPDAAAIGFLRYRARINSTELVDRLRRDKSVLIVPGDQFGLDGCLRISFGLPEAYLGEGLRRIQETLTELEA